MIQRHTMIHKTLHWILKIDTETYNDPQNTTQNTKDWTAYTTRIRGELRVFGRVNSSGSTNDTSLVTVSDMNIISHGDHVEHFIPWQDHLYNFIFGSVR